MGAPVGLVPDVAQLVIGELRAALAGRSDPYAAGVSVHRTVPKVRPTRFVTVRPDGGPVDGVLATARVGVNVYAGSAEDVDDLARLLAALLAAAARPSGVIRVARVTVPYELPDDAEQAHRYFTAELLLRLQPL